MLNSAVNSAVFCSQNIISVHKTRHWLELGRQKCLIGSLSNERCSIGCHWFGGACKSECAHQSSIWFIVFRLRYFTLRVNSQYNTRPLFSFTAKCESMHAWFARWPTMDLVLCSLAESAFEWKIYAPPMAKRRSMHLYKCISRGRSQLFNLDWPQKNAYLIILITPTQQTRLYTREKCAYQQVLWNAMDFSRQFSLTFIMCGMIRVVTF